MTYVSDRTYIGVFRLGFFLSLRKALFRCFDLCFFKHSLILHWLSFICRHFRDTLGTSLFCSFTNVCNLFMFLITWHRTVLWSFHELVQDVRHLIYHHMVAASLQVIRYWLFFLNMILPGDGDLVFCRHFLLVNFNGKWNEITFFN